MRLVTIYVVLGSLTISIAAQDAETPQETEAKPYEPAKQELIIDQRLAESLPADQIQWLGEGDSAFLARSMPDETGSPLGTVLIVTSPGKTIDSPGYVRRALSYFPTVSWNAVVISAGDLDFAGPVVKIPEGSETASGEESAPAELMVVDENDWYQQQQQANQSKLVARISAAAGIIPDADKGYILVIAGASAALALDAISNRQLTPTAVVLLDINHPVLSYRNALTNDLSEITTPMLDIYQPLEGELAQKRSVLSRKPTYEQRMIPGVNPDYLGVEDILLRSIRGWLKRIMK